MEGVGKEGHLFRNNYWILRPYAGQGPVDVAAISEAGDIYLFDAKKDARRVNPGRNTRARIHRVRSDIQKRLGVRIAYVDIDTRAVHIVPEIDEKTPQHCGAGGSCHRKRRWYKEVNKHD